MMKIGTDIAHAALRIQSGQLVAMPTETVYGLAANARDDDAIRRIYAAKGRPAYNPLIVHVASIQQAKKLAHWNDAAERLAAKYWPGPLTMVLKRHDNSGLSSLVCAGRDSIAIRMPAHHVAQNLLAQCALPLAAPSANISGHVTATSSAHVAHDFAGQDIYILEAGPTNIGLESTVIDLSGSLPSLLRPGSITRAQLQNLLNLDINIAATNDTTPVSPGMLSSHYAPNATLRLNAHEVYTGEALLAFGPPLEVDNQPVVQLSEQGDLSEASANLFAALRQLDALHVRTIAVMPIPAKGIGIAINDRLNRAAAPKPPSG